MDDSQTLQTIKGRFQILPFLGRYFLAISVTLVTTAGLLLVRSFINPSIVSLLYLFPVGLSTALWGLGPGIAAAFCAFLAFNYYFIPPYYTLLVHQTQDLLGLLVFLTVTVVISQLLARVQRSLAEARARERESTLLYELGQLLSGLRKDEEILHALGEHVLKALQADQVDLILDCRPGTQPARVRLRAGSAALGDMAEQANRPDLLVPLEVGDGFLGELRLWRRDPPIQASDERLLRTFVSQGVLTLERARLGQAETRARVLEESDRLKTSLLSSVSHDLRTPLSTIKAAVSSLRSEAVDWESEARRDLLEMVEEETNHLNQLVENLLNMSRIEAGALKPQRAWNVLAEIVNSVIDRRHPERTHDVVVEGHRIVLDLPDDLPLVPVDYVLMEQVFANLLGNSLKYSPPSSTIRISAKLHKERFLIVEVSNEGPPVPDEHLERIFDKFTRLWEGDRVTGTGLGLSICKGIVEAHGGKIWAGNLPGGFAFFFTLPIVWEGAPARVPEE